MSPEFDRDQSAHTSESREAGNGHGSDRPGTPAPLDQAREPETAARTTTRTHSSRFRFWPALGVALAADLLQLAVFPLFVEGAVSPWNDALDFVVAVSLTLLLGWHWAFLPTLAAELMPGAVVVPTWTAAVLVVGWKNRTTARLPAGGR